MLVIIYISFAFLSFYIIQIILFTKGFLILDTNLKKNTSHLENKKYISVIIPFKNEEENLSTLIQNLKTQTLNSEHFEIIFINDNSNDNSEKIIKNLVNNIPDFHLINSEKNGKKNAIKAGIQFSQTNLIVTTDADCIHQASWLEEILNYYLKHKPKMIIAPVLMTGETFFQKLQTIDFLSLTASTAGAAGIKRPIMCNGANLVYEKKVFEEFNDAFKIEESSGDDIFLLHNVKKNYPKEIQYLQSKRAIVFTEAEKSIKAFFRQRIRWASKSKSYKDFDTILSAFIVFSTNLAIVLLTCISIFSVEYTKYLLIIWGLKTLADFIFLIISGNYFTENKDIGFIPLLSFLYPFYVSYIAFVSFFTKNIRWKTK